mmetsp:Transcript_6389/g.18739  ORF Transcript_6389/g.18739 Transcript_6389/m.18739 type:complete len:110 (+) Transcript_6389:5772-6101(+)
MQAPSRGHSPRLPPGQQHEEELEFAQAQERPPPASEVLDATDAALFFRMRRKKRLVRYGLLPSPPPELEFNELTTVSESAADPLLRLNRSCQPQPGLRIGGTASAAAAP